MKNTRQPIHIIDTTLREGNQSHGACFDEKKSMEIALALANLGIDMIEVGHPYSSELEMQRVKAVTNLNLPCPILAHARAHQADVQAVAESGANWIGIFSGVNDTTRQVRIQNRTVAEIITLTTEAIKHAKKLGLKIRYTVEDASRTSLDLLLEAYSAAIKAGANRICYSDTVGILEPQEVSNVIQSLYSAFPNTDIEVHFHDDRGLALANALAAMDAGATWVSTSVNGLGERSGITDTCAFIANLAYRKLPKYQQIHTLKNVSRLVAMHARSFVDSRRPVIGKNAFHHKAKLHTRAVKMDDTSYNWISPALFGLTTTIDKPELPRDIKQLICKPSISNAEKFIMLNESILADCRQACTVIKIYLESKSTSNLCKNQHENDSKLLFLTQENNLAGLQVEMQLAEESFIIESPIAVFIPAGIEYSYKALSGSGLAIHSIHEL